MAKTDMPTTIRVGCDAGTASAIADALRAGIDTTAETDEMATRLHDLVDAINIGIGDPVIVHRM